MEILEAVSGIKREVRGRAVFVRGGTRKVGRGFKVDVTNLSCCQFKTCQVSRI
jgi:hypothetical protein